MHDQNKGITQLDDLVKALSAIPQDKTVPLVFVSGFAGWIAPIFDTFNYFGGFKNIPLMLSEMGYKVLVVRLGPISSNWERACEMYAQLTASIFDTPGPPPGTDVITIDYGQYFTERTGLPRSAKNRKPAIQYGGFPAGWKWSEKNKVHFICHSQGGLTVRLLIKLMQGDFSSRHSKYFTVTGRDSWTKSVVTLGTPHNGTTIIDVLRANAPAQWRKLVDEFVASASFNSPANRVYDLALDQWGFNREANETYEVMYDRLRAPGGPIDLWVSCNLNGFFDNSIEGVNDLNTFCGPQLSTNVFFFTMSFEATRTFNIRIDPEDITTFPCVPSQLLQLIPGFPLLLGLTGNVLSYGIDVLMNIGLFGPPGALYAWVARVASRHLQELGFQVNIPSPGAQIPRADMFPPMLPTGYAMGGYSLSPAQQIILNSAPSNYQPNDGIVNTISMRGPNNADVREITAFPRFNMGSAKGVFWNFATNHTLDHADEIGAFTEQAMTEDIELLYECVAALMTRLPSS